MSHLWLYVTVVLFYCPVAYATTEYLLVYCSCCHDGCDLLINYVIFMGGGGLISQVSF